jgi:hypothetical protein
VKHFHVICVVVVNLDDADLDRLSLQVPATGESQYLTQIAHARIAVELDGELLLEFFEIFQRAYRRSLVEQPVDVIFSR